MRSTARAYFTTFLFACLYIADVERHDPRSGSAAERSAAKLPGVVQGVRLRRTARQYVGVVACCACRGVEWVGGKVGRWRDGRRVVFAPVVPSSSGRVPGVFRLRFSWIKNLDPEKRPRRSAVERRIDVSLYKTINGIMRLAAISRAGATIFSRVVRIIFSSRVGRRVSLAPPPYSSQRLIARVRRRFFP